MRYPSKICTFEESSISKFSIILEELRNKELAVLELYYLIKKHFNRIDEYIEVLGCLYALGKIEYNSNTRRLRYVI